MNVWALTASSGLIGALLGVLGVRHRGRHRLSLVAVDRERARIARDLHDDLGAMLTEITMLASGRTVRNEAPERVEQSFAAIAKKARASVEALDLIIWAINPVQDTLESLVNYTVAFTREYLENAGIVLRIKISTPLPKRVLDSATRHHLFCSIKEVLNNAVRHANATEIVLSIESKEERLQVSLADNGRGFSPTSINPGNGLRNLRARMAEVGGSFTVQPGPAGGTVILLTLPLPCLLPL
ncbi:MAG: hypothetical protein JWL59_3165 [Chthoniobacteraceae bacterium]|nr:hypothetical protein [Chthoniobacteraceae bacterium]